MPTYTLPSDIVGLVWRVAEASTGHSKAVLVGPRRERAVSLVRHAVWRVLFDLLPGWSLSQIGRSVKRDHSSVIAAMRHYRSDGCVEHKLAYAALRSRVDDVIAGRAEMPKRVTSQHGWIDRHGAIICIP